jgi:uncharacterized protein YggE
MAEVETHGTGQVERIADRAGLQVFYTEQAKDRASAVSTLTKRIGTVESMLERDGVQVRDRRLFVHDTWDVKRRSGAQANQSYLVRITALAVLNDLVADLVLTEPTNLRGPSWELADRDEAVRQAQQEAVADARRRAEGYVEALGRRLGPLLRITDGVAYPQPDRFTMNAVRSPADAAVRPNIAELSLEPQLVTVVTTCTTAWEIAD